MATNQRYDRVDSFTLPVADGCPAGVAVISGTSFCGVTRAPEGEGVGVGALEAIVDMVGGYELTVTGATTPGTPIYMTGTPTNGYLQAALTTTSSTNTLWGYALTTKGSGSGLATCRPRAV